MSKSSAELLMTHQWYFLLGRYCCSCSTLQLKVICHSICYTLLQNYGNKCNQATALYLKGQRHWINYNQSYKLLNCRVHMTDKIVPGPVLISSPSKQVLPQIILVIIFLFPTRVLVSFRETVRQARKLYNYLGAD